MKDIKTVQKEIDALLAKRISNPSDAEEKEQKKLGKQRVMRTKAKTYLETSPRESFVLEQKHDMETKIQKVKDGFETWLEWFSKTPESATIENKKTHYEKLSNVPQMRNKLKMLNYLLS